MSAVLAAVVVERFPAWVEFFEGRTPWMYNDSIGVTTTAVGNALFSAAQAQRLPWRRSDGAFASPSEIAAAWTRVHARTDLNGIGGGSQRWPELTSIRLSDEAIDALVRETIDDFAGKLAAQLPGFGDWIPAAQLATLSMAWGMGPGFPTAPAPHGFPKWRQAALRGEWDLAAAESHETNGVPARNAANAELFHVAAKVARGELGHDTLTDTGAAPPSSGGTGGKIVAVLVLIGLTYAATRA